MYLKRFFLFLTSSVILFASAGPARANVVAFSEGYTSLMLVHIHTLAVLRVLDHVHGKAAYDPSKLDYDQAAFDDQPYEYQYRALLPYYILDRKKDPVSLSIKNIRDGIIIHAVAKKGLSAEWCSTAIAPCDPAVSAELANPLAVLSDADNLAVLANIQALIGQGNAGNQKAFGYILSNTVLSNAPLWAYTWAGLTVQPAAGPQLVRARQQSVKIYEKIADYFDKSLADVEYRTSRTRHVSDNAGIASVKRVFDLSSLNLDAKTNAPRLNPDQSTVPAQNLIKAIAGGWGTWVGSFYSGKDQEFAVKRYLILTRFDNDIDEIVQLLVDQVLNASICASWAGLAGDAAPRAPFNMPNEQSLYNSSRNFTKLLQYSVLATLSGQSETLTELFLDLNSVSPLSDNVDAIYASYKSDYRPLLYVKEETTPDSVVFFSKYKTYPQFMQSINTSAARRLASSDAQFNKKGELLYSLQELVAEGVSPLDKLGIRGTLSSDNAWGVFEKIMKNIQPYAVDAMKERNILELLNPAQSGARPWLAIHKAGKLEGCADTAYQGVYNNLNARLAAMPAGSIGLEGSKRGLFLKVQELMQKEGLVSVAEVNGLSARIDAVTAATYDTLANELDAFGKKVDYFGKPAPVSRVAVASVVAAAAKPKTASGREIGSKPTTVEQAKDNDVTLAEENRVVTQTLLSKKAQLNVKAKGAAPLSPAQRVALRSEVRQLENDIKLQRQILKMPIKTINKEIERLKKAKALRAADKERLRMLQKRQADLSQGSKLTGLNKQIIELSAQLKAATSPAKRAQLQAAIRNARAEFDAEKVKRGSPATKKAPAKAAPVKPSKKASTPAKAISKPATKVSSTPAVNKAA